jgi:hypothetical protein
MRHTWQAYTPEDTPMEQHFKENEGTIKLWTDVSQAIRDYETKIMVWGIHRNDIEV